MGRSPVCGCKPRLYQSDLLKLWASAENAAVGKSFQMPVLRSGVRPRPQCCGKHFGIGAAIPGYQPLEAHDFSRGSSHKRLSFIANDWREFYKWFRDTVDKKDFASEEFPLEGYVIQDSSGEVRDCTWIVAPFMAKVKTPYYDFWKFMRSVKDSVGKGKEQNINTSAMWSELHNEFFFWLKQQDKEYLLETDIIRLRNKFQSGKSKNSDLSL